MGSTSSVDRKAGVAEVMANECPSSVPTPVVMVSSTGGTKSAPRSDKDGAPARERSRVGIRRKNAPRGHLRELSNGSNSSAGTPGSSKRNIKLFDGEGPVTSWTKGNLVGKGATGAVYEAVDPKTQGVFCVKEIEFADDFADNPHDMQRFESLRREIELLKDIHHPNVVHFLGVDRINFIIYIQMEYVYGGNIQDIVRNFGPLQEETAGKFMLQILSGLDYLHKNNIIHRDIKGANILVGVNGTVKLADFGAAKRVLDHEELFKTLAGTPYWMAPEVVRQEGHNKAADVWSLGATLFQMLTGSAPYQSLPPVPALFKIGHSTESPVPAEIPGVSKHALQFLRDCLTREASQRPTVHQLLSHPWIEQQRAVQREREMSKSREREAQPPPSIASPNSTSRFSDSSSNQPERGMALRTSQLMGQDVADEEAQIKQFVAYVSERHRALRHEQQEHIKATLDSPDPDRRDDSNSQPSTPRSAATTSSHVTQEQQPQWANTAATHRLPPSDDEDDGLPPIGATHPGSPAAGVQRHQQIDDDDDIVFEDEFDEAHFDAIIAGLGGGGEIHPTH